MNLGLPNQRVDSYVIKFESGCFIQHLKVDNSLGVADDDVLTSNHCESHAEVWTAV